MFKSGCLGHLDDSIVAINDCESNDRLQ